MLNTILFDRSGFASLDDLDLVEYNSLYKELENYQEQFLSRQEDFRSDEYIWPYDALHNCFRIWEYPYVYNQLKRLDNKSINTSQLKLMDFGSGVTFFPFLLASKGFSVIATDIDPVNERDFNKAIKVIPFVADKLSFKLTHPMRIPELERSIDVIYCISVLEHIPNPSGIVAEMARVLKDKGTLILTIDVCYEGDSEIKAGPFNELMQTIKQYFDFELPEITIHPSRLLNSDNSPFPYVAKFSLIKKLTQLIKNILKRILGRKLTEYSPVKLVCMGMVLRKK